MLSFNLLQKINILNEIHKNEVNNYILYNLFNYVGYSLNDYNLYLGCINFNKKLFCLLITSSDIQNDIDFVDDNIIQINIYNNTYYTNFDKVINKINNFSYIKNNSIKIYINDNAITPHNQRTGCNYYFLVLPISIDIIEWIKADLKIFNETYEDYNNIALPYINAILNKNTKWINNILFNGSEKHLVLYKSSEFIITKDIHWKNNTSIPHGNNFYLLAFPIKNIKTIRDLSYADIELLENMKNKSIEIANMYGISNDRLYMFFHYHPSYYHLHLHICVLGHYTLQIKYNKQYELNDIIEKLKIDSNYWKNADLKFELLSTNKLYGLLYNYKKMIEIS
jgi:m7GpppX diphosphatase